MKEPMKLYRMAGDELIEAGLWACGECGGLHKTKEGAEECCLKNVCACGQKIEDHYRTSCRACREKAAHEREIQRWQKMPDFENYSGEPLYDGSYHHSSLEDYIDEHIDDDQVLEEDIEEFLEVCEKKRVGYNVTPEMVLDFMIERATEDIEDYENFCFKGGDEFSRQIREFLEKQESYLFVPIYKKIHTKTEIEKLGIKVVPMKTEEQ